MIGQQPLLKPGESFEYTSGTHLATPVGTMRGTYQMVAEDGSAFDAHDSACSRCRCRACCIRNRRGGLRLLRPHRPPHDADRERERDAALPERTRPMTRYSLVAPTLRCAHASAAVASGARRRLRDCVRHRRPAAAVTSARCPRPSAVAAGELPSRSPSARSPAGTTTACRTRGPRFVAGCAALVEPRRRAPRALDARAAPPPETVDPLRSVAVSRVLRDAILAHTRSPPPTAATDGHRHRLLRAAARRQPHEDRALSRCRSTRRPTICSPSISPRSIPSSRTSACADASRAARSCRTGRAPRSRTAARPVAGKVLVYVDDPVEAFFLRDPGLRARQARRRQHRCASATPTRTAIRTDRSGAC